VARLDRRLEQLKLRGLVGGGTLAADLSAALTVALVGLPQCLAYALMSGVPPIYGLVTALVPGLVAAIVGKSPHVVTGPTNTTGLLILAALTPFLGSGGLLEPSGLGVLAALTLMAGLVRVVAALLGGSTLVDFIPESVLAGFTAGAGVLITVMQLDELLGLENVRGTSLVDELGDVYAAVASSGVGWGSIALGGGTAVAIAVAKRRAPKLPVPLLAVALATGALDAARARRIARSTGGRRPRRRVAGLAGFRAAVARHPALA
jgi:sulfate permease, SulP family